MVMPSPPRKARNPRAKGWTDDEKKWLDAIFQERHDEIMAIPVAHGRGDGALRRLADDILSSMPGDVKGRMINESEDDFNTRCRKRSARLQQKLVNYRHMQRTGDPVAPPAAPTPAPLATVQLVFPGVGEGNQASASKTTNVQFSVPKLLGKKKPTKFTGKSLYVRVQGLMRRLQSSSTEDSASSDLAYLQALLSFPDSEATPPDPSSPDATLAHDAASSPNPEAAEGSASSPEPEGFKVNEWRRKMLAEFDALPERERKVFDDMAALMYSEVSSLYKIKERPNADQRAALIEEVPRVLKEMWEEQARCTNFSGLTITGGPDATGRIQFYMYAYFIKCAVLSPQSLLSRYPAGTNARNQNLFAFICERANWTWTQMELMFSEWFASVAGDQPVTPSHETVQSASHHVLVGPEFNLANEITGVPPSSAGAQGAAGVAPAETLEGVIASVSQEKGVVEECQQAPLSIDVPEVMPVEGTDGFTVPDDIVRPSPCDLGTTNCAGLAEDSIAGAHDATFADAPDSATADAQEDMLMDLPGPTATPDHTGTQTSPDTAPASGDNATFVDVLGTAATPNRTQTRPSERPESPPTALLSPGVVEGAITQLLTSGDAQTRDSTTTSEDMAPDISAMPPPVTPTQEPRLEYIMAQERVKRDAKRVQSRQAGLKASETRARNAAEAAAAAEAAGVSEEIDTIPEADASPVERPMVSKAGSAAIKAARQKKATQKEMNRQRALRAAETRKKNRASKASQSVVQPANVVDTVSANSSSSQTTAQPEQTRTNVSGRQRRVPERYNTERQPYDEKYVISSVIFASMVSELIMSYPSKRAAQQRREAVDG
ncbi:hypothetical protein EIP86_008134 [Pleurotus ostreatoroseus]|nr:hypothetical protein EIP86_008134 [Pleurotus ostreatoroseus]